MLKAEFLSNLFQYSACLEQLISYSFMCFLKYRALFTDLFEVCQHF